MKIYGFKNILCIGYAIAKFLKLQVQGNVRIFISNQIRFVILSSEK